MAYSPERHLVASVVLNDDMATAVKHGVSADMFHVAADEWKWIEQYYLKYKKAPSRIAFSASWPDFRLAKVNDTGHFADEVRKAHARHLLVEGMSGVADFITDGDVDTAIKKMHSLVISVSAGMGSALDDDVFRNFDDIWADAEARYHRVQNNGASGVTSGIKTIDEEVGGYNPGELIVIAARLGEGKSWIMQHGACSAVVAGHTVQFDALEQSRSQVTFRLHSLLSGSVGKKIFKNTQLMQGKVPSMREYKEFILKLQAEIKGKLHISDASRGRVSSLSVASQIERNKPDIVYVDYLGLMSRGPDWQGMAVLTGELKQIASEYQVPIVVASQLNRENGLGKEPPGAEALALSDAVGQDADMVITMKLQSPHVLKMRMAKNRNGGGDQRWYMHFAPGDGIIKEISANKAIELIDKDREEQVAVV